MAIIGEFTLLGTKCTLNMHSIHITYIHTRNVKVPNQIECALSQFTSVSALNPVRSEVSATFIT